MGDPGFEFYRRLHREVTIWLESEGRDFPHAHLVSLVPDMFQALSALCLVEELTKPERAKVLGAIIYFVSPIDLVPERLVGGAGYLDDVALAAYVLKGIAEHRGDGFIAPHWSGDGELVPLIDEILGSVEAIIGSELWRKIRATADSW